MVANHERGEKGRKGAPFSKPAGLAPHLRLTPLMTTITTAVPFILNFHVLRFILMSAANNPQNQFFVRGRQFWLVHHGCFHHTRIRANATSRSTRNANACVLSGLCLWLSVYNRSMPQPIPFAAVSAVVIALVNPPSANTVTSTPQNRFPSFFCLLHPAEYARICARCSFHALLLVCLCMAASCPPWLFCFYSLRSAGAS